MTVAPNAKFTQFTRKTYVPAECESRGPFPGLANPFAGCQAHDKLWNAGSFINTKFARD